eukprot:348553-Rhodomonas_salina.2
MPAPLPPIRESLFDPQAGSITCHEFQAVAKTFLPMRKYALPLSVAAIAQTRGQPGSSADP